MTVNSPSRSSRRDSWEASMQQQQQQENNDITNGIGFGQSTTPVRGRSPVSQKARRSVTPPRSGGESDDEDGDFDDYDFNDNDSVCSGSEEPSQPGKGTWTREEHRKFLEAIKIYVNGPWKLVAEYVGTRTVRQTMTHAQKYRQKAARRIRGLRTKQAIMRMHHGHEVSEESMVQEQIRTMLGQSRHAYLPPDLVATLSNSPYGSPVGSPYMPSSPVMPRSPLMSPAMPGSPVMNGDPGMFAHDPMSMGMPPSLLSSRLETPLSITIRSAHMGGEDSMPVYAPATPPPSYGSSPATSPVSALTNRMAMHGLASPVAQHQGGGGFEADIFDGFDTTPSFDDMNESQSLGHMDHSSQSLGHMDHSSQSLGHMDHSQQSLGPMDSSLAHIMNPVSLEDANVLMEVLFDGPSSLKDEPQDTHLMPQQNQFDIDI